MADTLTLEQLADLLRDAAIEMAGWYDNDTGKPPSDLAPYNAIRKALSGANSLVVTLHEPVKQGDTVRIYLPARVFKDG